MYATQQHTGVPESADGSKHAIVPVLQEDGAAPEGATLSDGTHPEVPAQIAYALLLVHFHVLDDLGVSVLESRLHPGTRGSRSSRAAESSPTNRRSHHAPGTLSPWSRGP